MINGNLENKYKASAPGSIMLMGEHAVLRNELAIVGAVAKRITATLTPQDNNRIEIYSTLGNHHTTLDELKIAPPFQFLLAAIQRYQSKLTNGFRLEIKSEFSSKVGLGSSAAVVVATLACLQQYLKKATAGNSHNQLDHQELFLDARATIQAVQGRGSGADVAASVFGGVVAYRMEPLLIEKSNNLFDIALLYTGYKTATPEVIRRVDARVSTDPEKYAALFKEMGRYSENAWKAIKEKNWIALGKIMRLHQYAQEQLGTSDDTITQFLSLLNQHKDVLGSKISGSGLGDCLLALVKPEFQWKHPSFIDATLSIQGVTCESQ